MNIISSIIGIVVLLIIISILISNQIITKKNRVTQAYGSIEIYLKKRFDLIPNLIATLNKYVAHEKEILLKVTELRTVSQNATKQNEKIAASNELTSIVGKLNINVENYPELKADTQFKNLQFELVDIEDQLSAARRTYNACVTDYNNKIEMFPTSIIAAIRRDKINQLLEIPKAEQKYVNVNDLLA